MTQFYTSNTTGNSMSTPSTGMGSEGPGVSDLPPGGQATPPSNPPGSDSTPTLIGGGTIDPDGVGYGQNEISINQSRRGSHNRYVGRMDMRDLGNSSFSILGMRNEGTKITSLRGIEGSDVSIMAAGGSAALTADGYVFGAKGLVGTADSTVSSQITTLESQFVTPEDVVNDDITITAKVTCGTGAAGAVAVIETTATIVETQTSVSHSVKISTNTTRQTVDLLPLTKLQGLKNNKNRVEIKIVRKPGVGSDTAATSSVILHNLDVRMNRASIPGKGNAVQFSTFS